MKTWVVVAVFVPIAVQAQTPDAAEQPTDAPDVAPATEASEAATEAATEPDPVTDVLLWPAESTDPEAGAAALSAVRSGLQAAGREVHELRVVRGERACRAPSCILNELTASPATLAVLVRVDTDEVVVTLRRPDGTEYTDGSPIDDGDIALATHRALTGAISGETGTIRIWVTSTPENATLSLDGQPAGTLPQHIEVFEGPHTFVAHLGERVSQRIEIEITEHQHVHLTLLPEVAAVARTEHIPSTTNFVLGGTLFTAGLALSVGPIITLIRNDECESRCDEAADVRKYDFGGQSIGLLIAGGLFFAAGLVFAIGRPIRAAVAATPQSAHLSLEGMF